ncbi:hypothetical protein HS088_TW21G00678 [Tripterygium wilfordii]|uniref:Uncharacterized protein n=1 Tax=Tripterygium wilfordii TaxID=458696 RepID=A0A7J7C301_TRIWF|nr:hypothetical protein HS088_TW21G00678 [Tripterygium wilfordii]
MGIREAQEAVVLQSSIALLQERFRELHRVKKEREERELLKMLMMLPDDHHHNHEPLEFTLFSQPERVLLPPKPPPLMLSLSLWPCSQQSDKHGDHDHLQVLEAKPTLFKNSLFPMEKVPTLLNKLDDFDMNHNDCVDTSLHL